MKCIRKNCHAQAVVAPAMRCKTPIGGNIMWSLCVPLCQPHTQDAVVDVLMTGKAYDQLCAMIRKEGFIPPEKTQPFDFIPLEMFSVMQQAAIATASGSMH